jgi:hypothetical protein
LVDENRAFAREFLYKALDDAQGTIRSLDAKAGVGIVVLGAMLGRVFEREQVVAIRAGGWIPWAVASIFAVLGMLAAILAFRTVFPMINPAENVSVPDDLRPAFFVAHFSQSRIWRLFSSSPRFSKLAETHESYTSALLSASAETIEQIVAAEVLKVSFIRQMKTARLAGFAKVLTGTVLIFILLLWTARPNEPIAQPIRAMPCTEGNVSIEIGSRNSSEPQQSTKHH